MHVAIVLFDNVTLLDAVGPHEVLHNHPDLEVTFVATTPGVKRTEGGLPVVAEASLDEVPSPDIVLVPGGPGQAQAEEDEELLAWLRAADATTTWTTSVCTGALVLGAAGLLRGKRATTYWMDLDELERHGATPVKARYVFDGKYATAAGVSAGIDMALALVERISGDFVAQAIQLGIEYDPHPPFTAGSPDRAPAEVVDVLRARARAADRA